MRPARSWRLAAVVAILRLTRRNRAFASPRGLMAGIARVRRQGAAPPTAAVHRVAEVAHMPCGGGVLWQLSPRDASARGPSVLYLHGGAYCRPIVGAHWDFIAWLVGELGCTVHVLLYPLAPEADCMAAVSSARAAWAVPSGAPGQDKWLMGDSAGAGLALALAQALRDDEARPGPAALVLITPWLDVGLGHPGIAATAPRDPMLAVDGLREAGRLYAGVLGIAHPWVSPAHAALTGLPPMQIFAATDDILGPDALDFAQRLRQAGGDVALVRGERMPHVWPLMPIPEAGRARAAIADYVRARSAGPAPLRRSP